MPIFEREDSSDCGGVSTRGHGQREGPDGDKWSKTTQETLGGSGVSEANGVLHNHYYPPGAILYKTKRVTNQSSDFLVTPFLFAQHARALTGASP